jgi:hypothetical protein
MIESKLTSRCRYFKQPFYDVETADFAEEAKQPFGFAEFYTFPLGNGGDYGKLRNS